MGCESWGGGGAAAGGQGAPQPHRAGATEGLACPGTASRAEVLQRREAVPNWFDLARPPVWHRSSFAGCMRLSMQLVASARHRQRRLAAVSNPKYPWCPWRAALCRHAAAHRAEPSPHVHPLTVPWSTCSAQLARRGTAWPGMALRPWDASRGRCEEAATSPLHPEGTCCSREHEPTAWEAQDHPPALDPHCWGGRWPQGLRRRRWDACG